MDDQRRTQASTGDGSKRRDVHGASANDGRKDSDEKFSKKRAHISNVALW